MRVTCDQAIFTSVRTAMGEGYRIIAASRSVSAEEKQAMTRLSPSHDALCAPAKAISAGKPRPTPRGAASAVADPEQAAQTTALAFYSLPGGRLCIAHSCFAGAEHTGRGGQRVYTRNILIRPEDFDECGQNPFVIARALANAGGLEVDLKPPATLDEIELEVDGPALSDAGTPPLEWTHAAKALTHVFDGMPVIVQTSGDWIATAENLLLAMPGPLRAQISFSAGLRFSVSRSHRLQLLHDDKRTIQAKLAGRKGVLVDTEAKAAAPALPAAGPSRAQATSSTWFAFVERHWRAGDFRGLARRTSRSFDDVSPAGRERVGRLYNAIDEIPSSDPIRILTATGEALRDVRGGIESDMVDEMADAARQTLAAKLRGLRWPECRPVWQAAVGLLRVSESAAEFVTPVLSRIVENVLAQSSISALEPLLDVMPNRLPAAVDRGPFLALAQDAWMSVEAWLQVSDNQARVQPNDRENEARATLVRACEAWSRIPDIGTEISDRVRRVRAILGLPELPPTSC